MKHLLDLPPDYDQKPSWPLLLFLHGAGERGEDLELVRKHGPPKLIQQGQEFPFILVSPQCARSRYWEVGELAGLLDEILHGYKIDLDRVYLTGVSMGGYGTWTLAAYQPERFAAIIPICGGGNPSGAVRLRSIPAWVFHGAKDAIIPVEASQQMVEALREAGGTVKFTIYPEAGHDSWTQTYENPELYLWLLAQKRQHRL